MLSRNYDDFFFLRMDVLFRTNPTCHLKNFSKWPIFKVCLCILQACEVLFGVILSLGSVEKRRSAGKQRTVYSG